jgi:hypothetical protein
MRVFYIDEEEKHNIPCAKNTHTFYVKLENFQVPDELKKAKVIEATTVDELADKIMEVYNFKPELRSQIELWSKPMGSIGRERLDTLSIIPKDYEDVWVRGVANNKA